MAAAHRFSRAVLALLGLGAWLLLGTAPARAQEAPLFPEPELPPMIVATVNRVIDGNSIDAQVFGNRTAVGYLGVDTPPLNAACGVEARALNEYLAGQQVLLQEDPFYAFDDFGRRLFYVYAMDGTSIEDTLIRQGLGLASRVDARRGEEMVRLEDEAAAAGSGCLWSIRP